MERWIGKVALVTGASGGIGRGIAKELASHGMKVAACARKLESLQELEDEVKKLGKGEILPIRCDVRNESEILEMFEVIKSKIYGGVDICVNNAGIAPKTSLLEGSTEEWRDMLNVNVLALSICSREAVKSMRSRGVDDGQILHISSMAGHRPVANSVYSCTKSAVRALTEGLRVELNKLGSKIRVGSISPATVDTDLIKTLIGTPSFKMLDVSDVVSAAIYILSAPPHSQVHDLLIRSIEQPN